jgi:hypothetical protein
MVTQSFMPINVVTTPATLNWGNFTPVGTIIDPADGTQQDSYTTYVFAIEEKSPRVVNGLQAMAETFNITITPSAQIKLGTVRTNVLLSHEQFHYDVGIVCARALARALAALRAADVPALVLAFKAARQLHMMTRPEIIQKRYDMDTRHGTNAHYQKVWKQAMVSCLANPKSDQLMGFYL